MPLENSGNKIISIRYCKEKVVVKTKSDKLDIPLDVFTSFYLFKGKDLSYKEIELIKKQISVNDYYKYALKLAPKKMYSEHKLREKLYDKGANKSEVDEVITKLKKAHLVNDTSLVNEYLDYANEKNIGKNKIIAKLKEKGVFNEEISKIKFSAKDELRKANSYIDKLDEKYEKYPYKAKKDHVVKYLIAQGFDQDIAIEASNNIKSLNPKLESKKLEEDLSKALLKLRRRYAQKELKDKTIQTLARKGYKMNDILKAVEEKRL